jgi:hypothetical protein
MPRHQGPRDGYCLPPCPPHHHHPLGLMYAGSMYTVRRPKRGREQPALIRPSKTNHRFSCALPLRRATGSIRSQWRSMGVRGRGARTHVSLSYCASLPVSRRPLNPARIDGGEPGSMRDFLFRLGRRSSRRTRLEAGRGRRRVGQIAALIAAGEQVICLFCR